MFVEEINSQAQTFLGLGSLFHHLLEVIRNMRLRVHATVLQTDFGTLCFTAISAAGSCCLEGGFLLLLL